MGSSLPVPLPAVRRAPAVPLFKTIWPNGAWYQPPAPRAAVRYLTGPYSVADQALL